MPSEKRTALVVDGVHISRDALSTLLQSLGFNQVEEADSGRQAIEKLNKNSEISLVVSEWKQARLHGPDLLRHIRQDARFEQLPFIIVTSKSEAENVALAADLEVTHYLVKPVTAAKLRSMIQSLGADGHRDMLDRARREAALLERQGLLHKAEETLRRVADLYPFTLPRVQFERAVLHSRSGNNVKALQLLDEALEAAPQLARAWQLKAGLLHGSGRAIEAEDAIGRAIAISPDNPRYHVQLGCFHLDAGKPDKAKWSFMRALNTAAKESLALLDIFDAYAAKGAVEEALREFGPFLLARLDAKELNRVGLVLRRQGRVTEAIDIYRRALIRFPDSRELTYNLAVALIRNNQPGAALGSLQRTLAIDPDFGKARDLLQDIRAQGDGS
ncbi:MAG: tetratricopeptide repeat protein [Desulfohalobiaceae bacterium]